MTRHRTRFIALIAALVAPALVASTVLADNAPRLVQGPTLGADVAARRALIRRGRSQRYRPQARQELVQRLTALSVDSADFQKQISSAPMQVRMEVFKHFAAQQNTAVTSFTRRLHGMAKVNGKSRVQKPSKTFFEVSPDNFDLFKKVMGKNVVWFAVNNSPGHLHTLIADQGDGGKFHHNVYGEGGYNTNDATITGNLTQFAFPVVLTDKEMARFTSYMNAGLQNHSHGDRPDHKVYGFYAKGKKVTNIACTNWVTSSSIGQLPRWARTIDRRLKTMAAAGQVNVPQEVAQLGLHGALAAAATPEARQAIVTAVLGNNLTKWNKSAVKRMGKLFTQQATAFSAKPGDLHLRSSLAETLGLGRSQDPAKWSYDLLMSKKVPVVAILNGTRNANLASMELNMEIMGVVGQDGWVKKGSYYGSTPNAGALGVIPDGRSSLRPAPVTPAATPTPASTAQ